MTEDKEYSDKLFIVLVHGLSQPEYSVFAKSEIVAFNKIMRSLTLEEQVLVIERETIDVIDSGSPEWLPETKELLPHQFNALISKWRVDPHWSLSQAAGYSHHQTMLSRLEEQIRND